MQILHIVADMPFGGGLSESVPMLAEAEQRQGMAVCLATTQEKPVLKFDSSKVLKLEEAGVRVVTFRRSWPHFVYFSWAMLFGLGKEVRAADVVHIHSNWTFPVWWGGWLALRYKKTLVMSPRGCLDPVRLQHSAWKKRLVGWMDRGLLRRASVVHATCRDEKRWIEAFLECANAAMLECANGENIQYPTRNDQYPSRKNIQHSTLNIEHPIMKKEENIHLRQGYGGQVQHSTSNVEHPIKKKPRIVVIPNGVEEVH